MGEKPYITLGKIIPFLPLKNYSHWASKPLITVVFKQGYFVLHFLPKYH